MRDVISQVLEVEDDPFPVFGYSIGGIPKQDRFLLKAMVVARNKCITLHWLQPEPPTLAMWMHKLEQIREMESFTPIIRLQLPKHDKQWNSYTTYKLKEITETRDLQLLASPEAVTALRCSGSGDTFIVPRGGGNVSHT